MTYELVIRGGRIVDGTGRAAFTGDVAIADGKIAAIGKVAEKGRREIAADGLTVTPGSSTSTPISMRRSAGIPIARR